jgi:hypothetical protein
MRKISRKNKLKAALHINYQNYDSIFLIKVNTHFQKSERNACKISSNMAPSPRRKSIFTRAKLFIHEFRRVYPAEKKLTVIFLEVSQLDKNFSSTRPDRFPKVRSAFNRWWWRWWPNFTSLHSPSFFFLLLSRLPQRCGVKNLNYSYSLHIFSCSAPLL